MFNLFHRKNKLENSDDLLRIVKKVSKQIKDTPITSSFELEGVESTSTNVWYQSQGEHWIGWLRGYRGSGFYNRSNPNRTPKYIYNHIMCPPMLIWLAEVLKIEHSILEKAISSARSSTKYQTQCANIRKVIPWHTIEEKILLLG